MKRFAVLRYCLSYNSNFFDDKDDFFSVMNDCLGVKINCLTVKSNFFNDKFQFFGVKSYFLNVKEHCFVVNMHKGKSKK